MGRGRAGARTGGDRSDGERTDGKRMGGERRDDERTGGFIYAYFCFYYIHTYTYSCLGLLHIFSPLELYFTRRGSMDWGPYLGSVVLGRSVGRSVRWLARRMDYGIRTD